MMIQDVTFRVAVINSKTELGFFQHTRNTNNNIQKILSIEWKKIGKRILHFFRINFDPCKLITPLYFFNDIRIINYWKLIHTHPHAAIQLKSFKLFLFGWKKAN